MSNHRQSWSTFSGLTFHVKSIASFVTPYLPFCWSFFSKHRLEAGMLDDEAALMRIRSADTSGRRTACPKVPSCQCLPPSHLSCNIWKNLFILDLISRCQNPSFHMPRLFWQGTTIDHDLGACFIVLIDGCCLVLRETHFSCHISKTNHSIACNAKLNWLFLCCRDRRQRVSFGRETNCSTIHHRHCRAIRAR